MIKNCHMRHENGNCLPADSFYTANKNICEALHNAYELGRKSAQPECKTGHWVSQNGGGYCCSECGRYALDEVDGNFIHVAFKSNFCPYCGADMRGEKNE